jgi:hypothetical protein
MNAVCRALFLHINCGTKAGEHAGFGVLAALGGLLAAFGGLFVALGGVVAGGAVITRSPELLSLPELPPELLPPREDELGCLKPEPEPNVIPAPPYDAPELFELPEETTTFVSLACSLLLIRRVGSAPP